MYFAQLLITAVDGNAQRWWSSWWLRWSAVSPRIESTTFVLRAENNYRRYSNRKCTSAGLDTYSVMTNKAGDRHKSERQLLSAYVTWTLADQVGCSKGSIGNALAFAWNFVFLCRETCERKATSRIKVLLEMTYERETRDWIQPNMSGMTDLNWLPLTILFLSSSLWHCTCKRMSNELW